MSVQLNELPSEVYSIILRKLNKSDLGRLAGTSQFFHEMVSNLVWQPRFLAYCQSNWIYASDADLVILNPRVVLSNINKISSACRILDTAGLISGYEIHLRYIGLKYSRYQPGLYQMKTYLNAPFANLSDVNCEMDEEQIIRNLIVAAMTGQNDYVLSVLAHKSQEFRCEEWLLGIVASVGNLRLMNQIVTQQRTSISPFVFLCAAHSNNVDAFTYLIEVSYEWNRKSLISNLTKYKESYDGLVANCTIDMLATMMDLNILPLSVEDIALRDSTGSTEFAKVLKQRYETPRLRYGTPWLRYGIPRLRYRKSKQRQDFEKSVNSGDIALVKQQLMVCDFKLDGGILVEAIKSHSLEMVRYFVENHNLIVDLDILLKAAKAGSLEIVRYILEQYPEEAQYKPNVLFNAVMSGELKVVRYLIEQHSGKPTQLMLHVAINRKHTEVRAYLENVHDLKAVRSAMDKEGELIDSISYVLHEAAREFGDKNYLVNLLGQIDQLGDLAFVDYITCVKESCKANNLVCVEILLRYIQSKVELQLELQQIGQSMVETAMSSENYVLLDLIFSYRDAGENFMFSPNLSYLRKAICDKNKDMIEYFLALADIQGKPLLVPDITFYKSFDINEDFRITLDAYLKQKTKLWLYEFEQLQGTLAVDSGWTLFGFFLSAENIKLAEIKQEIVALFRRYPDNQALIDLIVSGGRLSVIIDYHRDGTVSSRETECRRSINNVLSPEIQTCGCRLR